MAYRSPKKYEPEQPGLFSSSMLNEDDLRVPQDNLPSADDESSCIDESDFYVASDNVEDPVFFISFGSGSSGNCSYVGDRRSGFLIDAGIDGKKVEQTLAEHGISMDRVRGICLTHDHGDHVRYVYSILRNHRHMKLYCTPKILNGMLRRHSLSRRIKDYHRAVYKEFDFSIGNFVITPFEVLHDGTDNCGFFINHGRANMAVATDLGRITPRVENYMSQAHFVVIESNYDLNMLLTGPYLDHLKARIRYDNGHLDNEDSARFIAGIYGPHLRYVFLCHLSKDNNTPDIALSAHRRALTAAHADIVVGDGTNEHLSDVQIIALPRYDATGMYVLRCPLS